GDESGNAFAADYGDTGRTDQPAAVGCRHDVRGKQALESRHVAHLRGRDEGLQQTSLLRGIDWRTPLARDVRPRPGDELPRVGFFDAEHVGDLAVGIVEGLAKYVRGALGR